MPDLGAIAAAASSIKTAFDMSKALLEIRDGTIAQERIIELNRVILAAQSDAMAAQLAHAALLDEVRGLKEEITRVKAWDAEKEKYKLTDIGDGRFAYALKEEMTPGEPPHLICANCYEDGRKSILQRETRFPGRVEVHRCPGCGNELMPRRIADSSPPPRVVTRPPRR